jgi:triphosphatase
MELEIKLVALPDEPLEADAVLREIGRIAARVGAPRTSLLDASYHDSVHGLLRRAGWILRCRIEDGGPVATVKGPGPLVAGIRGRIEEEVPLHAVAEPGEPLPSHIASTLAAAGMPMDRWPPRTFRSVVRRTAVEVVLTGGTVAELAIDHGEVQADGSTSPVSELELELVEGEAPQLLDAVTHLAGRFAVRPGVRTKAGRGMLLLDLLGAPPSPSLDAPPPELWETFAELEERRIEGGEHRSGEHAALARRLGIEQAPDAPDWNTSLWSAFARAARA